VQLSFTELCDDTASTVTDNLAMNGLLCADVQLRNTYSLIIRIRKCIWLVRCVFQRRFFFVYVK